MHRAPEERDDEREQNEARAEAVARNQAREAAVRDGADSDARIERTTGEHGRRCAHPAAGHDLGPRPGHVERALKQTLRIGAQLVADRGARHARRIDARAGTGTRDDLLPADPAGVVAVAIVEPRGRATRQLRARVDDLESRRVQTGLARREREHAPDRAQGEPPAAHRERQVLPDRSGELLRVDAGAVRVDGRLCLERRDLRHVEHIEDVDPPARRLDAAVAVDREVAERMRERRYREHERPERGREQQDPLHVRLPVGVSTGPGGCRRPARVG